MLNEINNPAADEIEKANTTHQHVLSETMACMNQVQLIGHSAQLQHIRDVLNHIAPFDANVLIQGDTGTGKEIAARYIHQISHRSGKFVVVHCGAVTEQHVDEELFGHSYNFTHPHQHTIGKFEYAKNGTLFLDEIELLPLSVQVKLLRVLQDRYFERSGSHQQIPIHCHIISATKSNLVDLCKAGSFREDLLYRLNVLNVDLPSLSEHREDIPALFEYFVRQSVARYERPMPDWTHEQMAYLTSAPWPGNIRELKNFADRFVLGLSDIQSTSASHQAFMDSLPAKVNHYEKKLIIEALHANQFHIANAASQLKIPKKTLYDKLKKIGISLRHHNDVVATSS